MECACAKLSYVTCPSLLYFSTLIPKRHDFRKKQKQKAIEHKLCFLTFYITFVRNISLSKNMCVMVFMSSTLYSRPILMKLEVSRQIFEKSSNVKFHENNSSGSQVVPCGQMDRRTHMTNFTCTCVCPCIVDICGKEKPTRCHLMIYCSYELLCMFWALICPSSEA
jgi:hypothetical protein